MERTRIVNIKKLIKDFCKEEDYEYKENYSGRGMYGRECVGIVCDNALETLSNLWAYLISNTDIGQLNAYDIEETLGCPRQDTLGMDDILYFPKIKSK